MINSLTGRITGHSYPWVYIQIDGVEWQVEVSAATFQTCLAAGGAADFRILTHLHVREDLLRIYGFASVGERQAFLALLSVSGIGPRQALKILSGTSVEALDRYLEEDNVDALTQIPGLGKKTAQRLILQLKGHLVTSDGGTAGSAAAEGASLRDELIVALTEMGFDRKRAEAALDESATAVGTDPAAPDREHEQEIFRRAIVALSGT